MSSPKNPKMRVSKGTPKHNVSKVSKVDNKLDIVKAHMHHRLLHILNEFTKLEKIYEMNHSDAVWGDNSSTSSSSDKTLNLFKESRHKMTNEITYKTTSKCMSIYVKSNTLSSLIDLVSQYDLVKEKLMKNDYGKKYYEGKSSKNIDFNGVDDNPISKIP